jgi:hypothetical protein
MTSLCISLSNVDRFIPRLLKNSEDEAAPLDTGHFADLELQALLSGALAGLNFGVVRGKRLAFEKLCLARTERLALMIRGRLLHRAHADVSSFQFHGGVCHPLPPSGTHGTP